MWPDFLARMPGSTAAIPCHMPRIFTSIMRFHSSTLTPWRGERGMMPALFTSTSTGPNCSAPKAANALTSARLVTSTVRLRQRRQLPESP